MKTKEEVLKRLRELALKVPIKTARGHTQWVQLDPEEAHCEADSLLLDLINDQEISDAYDAVEKWYA